MPCFEVAFEVLQKCCRYHLKDVIVGKIYFLLVRIKIKYMEIAIIKRETVGSAPNVFNENETIAKYEIMDGAPVRGEYRLRHRSAIVVLLNKNEECAVFYYILEDRMCCVLCC